MSRDVFALRCPVFSLNTAGDSLWSTKKKTVAHSKLVLEKLEDLSFGELRVYFNRSDWDTHLDGYIYTDSQWLVELKAHFKNVYGFSDRALKELSYSEQGMQGDSFVSLDAGNEFVNEFCKLLEFSRY